MAWVLAFATAVWGVFLVWYTVRAKWWKLSVGRNTFGVSLVLFLVLLRLTFIDVPEVAAVGYLVYGLAAIFGIQRIIYLEKAQHEHPRGHRSDQVS